MIKNIYDKIILKYPIKVLLVLLLGIAFLGYYATKLEIDASSQTLLLDDDKDLKFLREVNKRYINPNFLIVSFEPKKGGLLSKENLDTINKLTKDLKEVKSITGITSILNVPLFQSPVIPLSEIINGVNTLESKNFDKNFDKNLVKKELLNSPLYSNSLVSNDFKTTALVLNLEDDVKYMQLLEKKRELKKSKNPKDKEELKKTTLEFKKHRDLQRQKDSRDIEQIRTILKRYDKDAKVFLGGVNMIANDIVYYIQNDLYIYGLSLICLLIFILWLIFRNLRWLVIPISICLLSVMATAGILGFFDLEVTVISSNFISLQLIITLSIILHLIVRYRELNVRYKNASQYKLVINTVLSKIDPSFFAIVTTIAGFASLVFSGIEPVKNLGIMMSAGIGVSLILSFIIFPTILILLNKKEEVIREKKKSNFSLMDRCINIVENKTYYILIGSILVVIFSISGASKLIVENSFINYFKKDTQIYKSMKIIDENLGGTTPLDIIIKFKHKQEIKEKKEEQSNDDFDDFDDEFAQDSSDENYWFTNTKMQTILKVHNYLEQQKEIGKVQSFASILKLGKTLNKDKDLDSLMLGLLYKEMPTKYKDMILSPYINIKENEARISMRIIDSNPSLRRNEFLNKLKKDIRQIITNEETTFRLTNLMVLYNNMLQSLFTSQISTLGFVLIILFIMFLILFKSIKVALIALVSNLIPIGSIFGIMGWLNIPLDIMTITIAAISIGIGVDDTIHYIHRFKEELKIDHNYINAMERAHQSIGYAMVYTSLVVIVGFSILVLSNLIPTIYFGLLTVVVMVTILLSALLLLPKLLIIIKPFEIKRQP
ncbi:MAG: RND family transporter [Arcobacter sp.]|nr:RND family transporter [Arcobacter sp.]